MSKFSKLWDNEVKKMAEKCVPESRLIELFGKDIIISDYQKLAFVNYQILENIFSRRSALCNILKCNFDTLKLYIVQINIDIFGILD